MWLKPRRRHGTSLATTTPFIRGQYQYTVRSYQWDGTRPQRSGNDSNETILALQIELQTLTHWWIFEPSTYHDSFYNNWVDLNVAVPTQVTGALGETLAAIIMEMQYHAMGLQKIVPHPSAKSVDFIGEIEFEGRRIVALIECKATQSRSGYPSVAPIIQALDQLIGTRDSLLADGMTVDKGFVVITAYRVRRIFVIEMF